MATDRRPTDTDAPRDVSGLATSVQPGGAPDEAGSVVGDSGVVGAGRARAPAAESGAAAPTGVSAEASLHDQDASQIRNRQRGGLGVAEAPPGAPEQNQTLDKVWSDPGGEAYNYRNALVGAGGKADNHTDEVEAETPAETVRHLSDATLSPDDRDATAEAIARMGRASPGKA